MPSSTNSLTPSLLLSPTMTTSLQTPMQSQTSVKSLTDAQRKPLRELIARYWLEGLDLEDLEAFFIDTQMEYMNDWSDGELIEEIENVLDTAEFNTMLSEIGNE